MVVDDDRVVGYVSLTVGQVDTFDVPERFRKGMGQYPIPVVILARLAVSREVQGRGIGFGLPQCNPTNVSDRSTSWHPCNADVSN